MTSRDTAPGPVVGREVVLTTSKLARRAASAPRHEAENAALVSLAGELGRAASPLFQKIAETALNLCRAHSAGVSLLEACNGERVLCVRAVAGTDAPRIGSLAPLELSTGGIALERRAVQLFTHPERHFTYLTSWPRICEMLVAPLFVDGHPTGTLWVISHDESRELDAEDARLLSNLAKLAAAACRVAGVDRNTTEPDAMPEPERERTEFLATLAHELRNPLAPIRNALQIMRDAEGDLSTVAAARNMVERQLKHLVRLIDDLVDVAHVMQGLLELRTERVDLGTVIQAALETSRPLLEIRQQQVHVQRSNEPVYVEADLTRLAQVFANLLNNAVKYSSPGTQIRITAERINHRAVVTVADQGIGISPQRLAHIFDSFPRAARAGEGPQQGLGIGLTLVKRLVALHDGTVEAHSEGPNKGSQFTVSLPLAEAPAGEIVHDQHDPGTHAIRPSGRKILVVDDNKDSATSLEIMLRHDGHDVHAAHDGVEALEIAERFRPEVILLDIGMPRLDGYATATQLRMRPWAKGIRLIALTGWGQEEHKRRSLEAGFDQHLVKPVDPELLTRVLAQKAPLSAKQSPVRTGKTQAEPLSTAKRSQQQASTEPPPIKDPNPPDAALDAPSKEIPKVGSRDAPGG